MKQKTLQVELKTEDMEKGLKQPKLFTGLVPATGDAETTKITYLDGCMATSGRGHE